MAPKVKTMKAGGNGGSADVVAEAEKIVREAITIPAPDIGVATFLIRGTAPFVQHRFSQKAIAKMESIQKQGSQSRKGRQREARDFDADYKAAMYHLEDGGNGIPCSAFRSAMVSACKIVGFHMTKAKVSVFVEADGYDGSEALVRITKGMPRPTGPMPVRNETGVIDLRNRPMWAPGWEVRLRIKYNKAQFSLTDVANLLAHVGLFVGVGEGRPDSKNSCGMGWGLFEIVNQ